MAATITRSTVSKPKTTSLIKRIIADYPQFNFVKDDLSHWSPDEQTVFYRDSAHDEDLPELLHEIGHALLSHSNFRQDIDLINMETEAWQVAYSLATKYKLEIDQGQVSASLDTYREWLHARSRCPDCHQAGVQSTTGGYRCLLCQTQWLANDARQCGLRRYKK